MQQCSVTAHANCTQHTETSKHTATLCAIRDNNRFVVNSESMTPLACVEALQTHFTAALTAAAASTKPKTALTPAAAAPAVTQYRLSSTGVPLSPLPLRKLSGAVPPLLPPPPSHKSANNSISNSSNNNNNSSISISSTNCSRNSSSVLTSDLLTGLNAELAAEQSAERSAERSAEQSAEQAAGGSSAELSPRRTKLLNSAKTAATTAAPAAPAVVAPVVSAAYVGQCVWRALHAASRTASGGDSFFIVQDLFGGEGVLIKAARTAPPPIELVLAGLSLKVCNYMFVLHFMCVYSVRCCRSLSLSSTRYQLLLLGTITVAYLVSAAYLLLSSDTSL
jgi:hypothetical protein